MANGEDRSNMWRHLGRLVVLGPHNGAHRVALRAGMSGAIPLLVLWALGDLDLSLYAVFGSFTALYGRSHSHLVRLRMQASAAVVLVAAVAAGAAIGTLPGREWLVIPAAAVTAGVAVLLSDALCWHPPGPLFSVFALSACASIPTYPARIAVAILVAGASAAVATAIGMAGMFRARARTAAPTSWGASIRHALTPRTASDVVVSVVAVLLAGVIPTATHLGHPSWAMVAAASVTGPDITRRLVRATHRGIGTLLGVAVTAGVFLLHLDPIAAIAVVVLLQVAAELFVGRNYGLTMLFVTPLALSMVELAAPTIDHGALLRDRALETALGALVGVLVTLIVHRAQTGARHHRWGEGGLRARRVGPAAAGRGTSSRDDR